LALYFRLKPEARRRLRGHLPIDSVQSLRNLSDARTRTCGLPQQPPGDRGSRRDESRPKLSRKNTCGDAATAPEIWCNAGMRRAFTALLIAAASTSFAAQTATTAKPSSQAPADGSTVTVTGCLAKGDGANAFVLNNVRWDSTSPASGQAGHHDQQQPPAPSTPPPMTTPTTPSTAPADSAAKKTADDALQRAQRGASAEKLRIAGNVAQLKLADHVGHTITASGTLAASDPVVTPGVVLPDPPAGSKPAPKPSADSQLRVLNVRSITHVAGECR